MKISCKLTWDVATVVKIGYDGETYNLLLLKLLKTECAGRCPNL